MNYLFPFDKVPKDSRIVLYGAGNVGKQFFEQIAETKFCEIVLWLDKNADGTIHKKPEVIKNIDNYDLVVIAVENKALATEIKSLLMSYGVLESKMLHKIKYKIPNIVKNPESLFEYGYFEEKGMELFQSYPNWQQTHNSLTSSWQVAFLLGLISDYQSVNRGKIKNVLEIGVFKGVTSLYMLKAGLHSCSDFQLYGIDLNKDEAIGEAVFSETSIEEQKHYHLYRGCTTFDIEKIIQENVKIDMVFIEGGHSHPHPLFDLIHILPFLHNESVVMLHDVVDYMRPNAWGESFIFSAWTDKKYQTLEGEFGTRTTLGCIKIPNEKLKLYDNIRRVSKVPFRASPWKCGDNWLGVEDSSLNKLMQFMMKYYDNDFAEEIYDILKENLDEYEKNWLLYHHETKLFNYLIEKNNQLQLSIIDLQKEIKKLRQ